MTVRASLVGLFAVGCVTAAVPCVAADYRGMTQDLLLRWTPGERVVGLVWNVLFGFPVVVAGGLALRAWRRREAGLLVGCAVCLVFLVAAWVFGRELLEAWVWMDPEPGWAR